MTAFAEHEELGNCVDEEDDWSLKKGKDRGMMLMRRMIGR
jgi:hypothetical protein